MRRTGYEGKTLVVAPLSVLSSWEDHFNKMAPELKTRVINNKNKKLRDLFLMVEADVYILHYDVLRLMPQLLEVQWLHIIADECHRIQSRKAQQTKALKKLKTRYKTGLSGTPVTNKTDKFWSILNWLYPTKWKAYWKFYNQFVEFEILYPEGYHKIIGPKNEGILLEQIKPFYVRHLKKAKCCAHHPDGVQPY
ncbi:MAG: SNF2-related protein, partial [Saprospiraceae bacterium]